MSSDPISQIVGLLKSRPFACITLVQEATKRNDPKYILDMVACIVSCLDVSEDKRNSIFQYIAPNGQVRLERLNEVISRINT